MEQPKKAWYLSKIFWFNIVFGVIAVVFPKVREFLPEAMFESIVAGANIVLRLFFTDTKIIA